MLTVGYGYYQDQCLGVVSTISPLPHLSSVEETGVSERLVILVKVTQLPSGSTGTGAQMSVSKIGPFTTLKP